MTLKSETIVNGPFQENCYLVYDEKNMEGIFIDPGDEPEKLIRTADFLGVNVKCIYNTHGHLDHAGAVARIADRLKVPFAIHGEDEFLLESMPNQARMFGLPPMDVPKIDLKLEDGDRLNVGENEGIVIHTPGHTPGGVCFHFGDVVFVGDTLFAGSVGRSDLPGGSHQQLITSIKKRLLVLDERTVVYCGHGPSTTIGMEKQYNPFLNGRF